MRRNILSNALIRYLAARAIISQIQIGPLDEPDDEEVRCHHPLDEVRTLPMRMISLESRFDESSSDV